MEMVSDIEEPNKFELILLNHGALNSLFLFIFHGQIIGHDSYSDHIAATDNSVVMQYDYICAGPALNPIDHHTSSERD